MLTGTALSILLAEDEPAHAEAIRRAMHAAISNVTIDVAGTIREYRDCVSTRPPRIALLDLNLPDGRAVELLTSPPEEGRFPVLIMTSYGDERTAVEAMKSGALDYVVKSPEVFADMPRTVERALREWDLLQERKRAREAMRESEERYRQLFEAESDTILLIDNETGRIFECNNAASVLYGYSREELLGMKDTDLSAEPEESRRVSRATPVIPDRVVAIPLRFHRREDGTVFPVEITGRFFTRKGRPVHIVAIRDISERRRTEARIEHLNRVLRAIRGIDQLIVYEKDPRTIIEQTCRLLVEHCGYMGTLIVLTDKSGKPSAWAQAGMGETFQALEKELRAGVLPSCFAETRLYEGVCRITNRARTCATCTMAEAHAHSLALCVRLRHEEADFGYFAVVVDPTLGIDDEELLHLAEVARDIAFGLNSIEQSEAMSESEKARQQAEAELRQAQKMEAVGRLAGGVAHDFNNMLTVILGYTDAALEKLHPPDPLYQFLQQIGKAAQRSADLTQQLLAFSRKQVVEPRVVNLNEAVEEQKKMLGRLIGEDIELAVVAAEGLWNIRIDPTQVAQVLANLAVNARDAITDVGRVSIEAANVSMGDAEVGRYPSTAPGDYVMLAFSDTGCGMDAETRERIFESFFTTKEQGKGTGLGLSTVYGIVEQNGGFIHVYSEPGIGTTFRIYFPRFQGEAEPAVEKAKEWALSGSETVLVVEDEELILEWIRTILEGYGYRVLAAPLPGEALLMAEKHGEQIDMLITDVVMPSMNGKELSARLEGVRPGIKTLFMSGYTADVIAHRGVVERGADFIQKPFAAQTLGAKVREVLDRG